MWMLFSHGPVLSEWCLPAALQLFQPRGPLVGKFLLDSSQPCSSFGHLCYFSGPWLCRQSMMTQRARFQNHSSLFRSRQERILYVYIYMFEIVPNCLNIFFYVIPLRIDGFDGSISEKPRGPCRPVTGSSGWSRQIPFTPKGPAEPCCKVVPRWRSPGWIALLGTCLVWAKNHPLAGCFWSFRKHGVPLSYRRVSNSVWIWIHFLEEKRWCNTECIFWIHYIFFSSRYSCFLLAVQVLRKEWNRHGFSGHQFDVKFDAGHDIVSQSGAKTFLNLCLSNLVHFLVWRCTEMYTVETCWNQPK